MVNIQEIIQVEHTFIQNFNDDIQVIREKIIQKVDDGKSRHRYLFDLKSWNHKLISSYFLETSTFVQDLMKFFLYFNYQITRTLLLLISGNIMTKQ